MRKYVDNGNRIGMLANDISEINSRTKVIIFTKFKDSVTNMRGNYETSNEWEGIIANELSLSNKLLKVLLGKIIGSLKE